MIKRIALIFSVFLSAGAGYAAIVFMGPNKGCFVAQGAGGGGGGGAVDTSDVPFYWNCDTATSGQSPQKGAGTITIGAAYTSTTAVVGNGVDNNNTGNSGGRITISTSSAGLNNIDMSKGRVGMWVYPRETSTAADGDPFYVDQATGTGQAKLYWTNINGTNYWDYKDKSITFTPTVNTWQFIELAWDSSEATLGRPCEVFINGISVSQCSAGSTGSVPSGTSFRLGGIDGNSYSMIYDQVIVSTNPVKDLYSLRNRTSF